MSEQHDGGPAYPTRGSVTFITNEDGTREATPCDRGGMNLIDWFAGLAMQEMIRDMPDLGESQAIAIRDMAISAYDMAGAMVRRKHQLQIMLAEDAEHAKQAHIAKLKRQVARLKAKSKKGGA